MNCLMRPFTVGAAVVIGAIASRGANATLLTFDSLSPTFSAIPDGYGGLDWTNWWLENVAYYCSLGYCPNGYQQGVISSPNIAYQDADPYSSTNAPGTFSSPTPFTLNSFYATAAWKDDLDVTVTGERGGVVVDTTSFTVSTQTPVFEVLNWTNINSVTIDTSGGVYHGYQFGDRGPGLDDEIALDNLTINAPVSVPEAPAWSIVLIGLATAGVAQMWVRFRHRSSAALG
jgi:hypothetical protein